MKKIFLAIISITFFSLCALADEAQDVLKTFDDFVSAANSYSQNLASYYAKNAKIVRVVNKKTGGQQAVIIPFDRYLLELKNNAKYAKMTNYKNTYVNKKVTKVDNDYKLSATRIPRNDKTGLRCYYIFTKTSSGWKIKEENMTTNVQAFLNAK